MYSTLAHIQLLFVEIVLVLLIALAIGLAGALYQIPKFTLGLPWLKWLSLDEIAAMGYSRTWARILLPVFHKRGDLSVRPLDHLSAHEEERIEAGGFKPSTVSLHEFKLTKRTGRRRFTPKYLFKPMPGWKPAPA